MFHYGALPLTMRSGQLPPESSQWLTRLDLTENRVDGFLSKCEIYAGKKTTRGNANNGLVNTHVSFWRTRYPSEASLSARSHNLFEYHLNIWWIFQQRNNQASLFLSILLFALFVLFVQKTRKFLFHFWGLHGSLRGALAKGYLCDGEESPKAETIFLGLQTVFRVALARAEEEDEKRGKKQDVH